MSRDRKYPPYPKLRLSLPSLHRRRPGLLSRLGGGLWRRLSARSSSASSAPLPHRQPAPHPHIAPRHLPVVHGPEPEVQLKIAVPKPRPARTGPLAEAARKKRFQAGAEAPSVLASPLRPAPETGPPASLKPEASPAPAPQPRPAPEAAPPASLKPEVPPAPAPQPGPVPKAGPSVPAPLPGFEPAPRLGRRRALLGLALVAVLLVGAGVFYSYQRYAQPPPRAKVARIPAAGLPRVVPLEAGLFENCALSRERAILTEVTIESGSNLSKALEEVGLTSRSNYREVLDCLTGGTDSLDRILPGAVLRAFWVNQEQDSLVRLEFYPAPGALSPWVVLPKSQGGFWRYNMASRPMNISGAGAGKVEGSLWNAGLKAGLDGGLIMTMADVLAADIDFVTGLRKGDSFEVLYSRDYLDGRPQGAPVIEMVRMENNGRTFEYYRYINSKGQAGYYNPEGLSNVKTFLAAPLQYTRISSGFTKARNHPIYKIVRPHLGVDYAAPTGTPVSAVADGQVVAARWSGGFGRLVTIQHNATYTTMYGHLSSFAAKIKEGAMVKQGDLIGRVGATGAATGPHLDFRLKKNGVFVNPIPELAKQVGRQLEGSESKAFASVIPVLRKRLTTQLAQVARRPVALDNRLLEPEVEFGGTPPVMDLDF